jgi:type I restriction enzyme, R subunit
LCRIIGEGIEYSDEVIKSALSKLDDALNNLGSDLYHINQAVYRMLRYGIRIKPDVGEDHVTVKLIDWDNFDNNHFGVAEEVTVKGNHVKRPDIVFYVNGIALGVLELKRSTVSVAEGIRQNIGNQDEMFIQRFFGTMQLVMAGNETEGIRYGTIETSAKYYLEWKEDSDEPNPLLAHLNQLCSRDRFLEIIHDFIVFDAGTKKICRHNQYFGVQAAQAKIAQREGGIIWHTQGSGKSLTMVWLAQWIRSTSTLTDARVLIITDREELDAQIQKVFTNVGQNVYRTKSGANLLEVLNKYEESLICSLIHKFGGKEEDGDVDDFIDQLQRNVPPDFSAKGDLFVFVDECHRTQSGKLHEAMKHFLPNAIFIGFTGTPLLSHQKRSTPDQKSSIEVFGKYIHTYEYTEAVIDGVVLDLRYEARDIDQSITSQKKIDQWFDSKTSGLTDIARAQLKQKWGTMQNVLSSRSRLEQIVSDIILDMEIKDRLSNGRGNAMLVSGSIYEACKFYELFEKTDLKGKCAIITSYKPHHGDVKGEMTGEGDTETLEKYNIYTRMLGDKDPERFEKDVKKQFIEEPAQMKLLIVVDKLLTGFDAPSATYLYIDKKMRDHGLFQAICRVNRLDGEDKEYGYIIDYEDLFYSLEKSIKDYTSGAFDSFDKPDIEDLLTDRLEKGKQRLDDALQAIQALCEPVEDTSEALSYASYFFDPDETDLKINKRNETKRLLLYKLTASLVRAYANLANEMTVAGYTEAESDNILKQVEHYENVRKVVKIKSGDYIDLKAYEPAMRHLLDTYIRAEDSEKISAFDDMTLIQMIVEQGADNAVDQLPDDVQKDQSAVAETIEGNMRKIIIDENPVNPKYYEKMSELLEALVQERRADAIEYEEYLQQIADLSRQVLNPSESQSYPQSVNSAGRQALFDNLDGNATLALAIDAEIKSTKQDGWKGNAIKERTVRNSIYAHIDDNEELVETIYQIIRNQGEYN